MNSILNQRCKGDNSNWLNKTLHWNLLGQYQPIILRDLTQNQDKLTYKLYNKSGDKSVFVLTWYDTKYYKNITAWCVP